MFLKEIKMKDVTCTQVGHQGKVIEALCLHRECKESATLCSKCLIRSHIKCRN